MGYGYFDASHLKAVFLILELSVFYSSEVNCLPDFGFTEKADSVASQRMPSRLALMGRSLVRSTSPSVSLQMQDAQLFGSHFKGVDRPLTPSSVTRWFLFHSCYLMEQS